MQDQNIDIKTFSHDGHLTKESLRLWVDALMENREGELPAEVKSHVDECRACRTRTIGLYQDLTASGKMPETRANKSGNAPEKTHLRQIYRIAAAVALLFAIAYLIFFFAKNELNNPKLFVEYYTPYPNLVTVKSANTQLTDEAMFYYDMAQYDTALALFGIILEKTPENPEALFYKGICLLSLNKSPSAIQVFKHLAFDTETPYRKPALWYLALGYLQNGDMENTKRILLGIVRDDNHFSAKAKSLLQHLE
ncbi:MAG: hypothetical protein GXO88_10530 [Chlorobi bacterium]|nr:hypothetical protein [Chlorobiota bacterium]